MRNRILLPAVALAFACSGTPLNPNDFDIDGPWGGDFTLGGSTFPIGFTLSPKEDGVTERYDADGNFFTSFRNSRITGRAEYNTSTGAISIEFPLFPVPTTAMQGTVEGSTMVLSEEIVCFCMLTLVRQDSASAP